MIPTRTCTSIKVNHLCCKYTSPSSFPVPYIFGFYLEPMELASTQRFSPYCLPVEVIPKRLHHCPFQLHHQHLNFPVNVGSQPDMWVGWVKKMFVCVFFVGGKNPGGFCKTQQQFQWNSCFFFGGGKRSKLIYNWGHKRTHRGAITISAFPGAHLAGLGKHVNVSLQ